MDVGKKNSRSRFPGERKGRRGEVHLVVIRLSALGDVAMTIPVLRTLLFQYPQITITVLSKPFFKPLFADLPNLRFYEVRTKDKHKGLIGLWRLANEINTLRPHAIADLHNVLRSQVLKFLCTLKGIKVVQINKGRKEKKALTRHRHKNFKPLKTTYQRYADVFEKLGFPIDFSQHQFPLKKELTPPLKQIWGDSGKKHLGIAPYAAYEGKMYPPDLMEEVIAQLNETQSYTIFLFGGGQKEAAQLEKIAHRYENVINTANLFSFEEELLLIAHLDIMLAMDSGNAHLAAMYGVTTLTLWGVTHPFAGFYPFAQTLENALLADRVRYPLIPTSVYGNKYPPAYKNAMHTIAPEKIVAKLKELTQISS